MIRPSSRKVQIMMYPYLQQRCLELQPRAYKLLMSSMRQNVVIGRKSVITDPYCGQEGLLAVVTR